MKRTFPEIPYAALETSACAALIKESRLKCAEVTRCTGDPGNRSHDRSRVGYGARLGRVVVTAGGPSAGALMFVRQISGFITSLAPWTGAPCSRTFAYMG